MDISDADSYRFCRGTSETSQRILCECEDICRIRHQRFEERSTTPEHDVEFHIKEEGSIPKNLKIEALDVRMNTIDLSNDGVDWPHNF